MSDRIDDDRRPAATAEGVRILGAEEAQAALGQRVASESAPHESDTTPAAADREAPSTAAAAEGEPIEAVPVDLDLSEEPDAPDAPVSREGPTWSASEVGDTPAPEEPPAPGEPPSGEVPPLPHWTEPATGAVPAIFADDGNEDANTDPWTTFASNPTRFRAEGADWAEADFGEQELADDSPKLGALSETGPVDEDAAFARDLAARRRVRRGRPARTMVTTPPPAGRTPRPRPEPETPELVPQGPARSRDLPTAIATAAVVAVVALICFTQGTAWTNVFCAVVVAVGTLEFTAALQARGFRPASALALTASATLPLAAREYGSDAYPIFFGLVVVFTMLWFLLEVTPGRPLLGVATTVLAFAYVGGLGGFAGLLLASPDGVGLILGLALCTIAYDVVGFFVGSQFGKSPVAPRISPNKSFEGTLAGMLASVLMGWLLVGGGVLGGIHPWSPGRGAVLGLFVAAGAFLGDLCESMLKRDLGLKDFGSLLPGHGGVLDRFDALLFCLPITYFLALHLNIL